MGPADTPAPEGVATPPRPALQPHPVDPARVVAESGLTTQAVVAASEAQGAPTDPREIAIAALEVRLGQVEARLKALEADTAPAPAFGMGTTVPRTERPRATRTV
jgi:hypothetical protein